MLSLDSVAVALAWQFVLTLGLSHRRPALVESIILAITVWLVYVADRLLDASSIRLDRPHTLRHAFHARHAKPLLVLWIVGLIVDVSVALALMNSTQIRVGLLAATLVAIYLASVHFGTRERTTKSSRSRWNGKELLIGFVFAFGVALPVWGDLVQHQSVATIASVAGVLLSAGLFASNCWLVSSLESSLDRTQNFSSLSTAIPESGQWIVVVNAIGVLLSLLLGLLSIIPLVISLSLVLSFAGLIAMKTMSTTMRLDDRLAPGLIADTLLALPPITFMLLP